MRLMGVHCAVQNVASWAIPAILCALLYAVTKPARVSPLYAAGMAALYAVWVTISRTLLLERHYAVSLPTNISTFLPCLSCQALYCALGARGDPGLPDTKTNLQMSLRVLSVHSNSNSHLKLRLEVHRNSSLSGLYILCCRLQ